MSPLSIFMYPPSQGLQLDIDAISGICGSVSIACWVVVFSPQIIENFRRGSADGLSVVFIVVWLAGDIFNILGAVLQGVIPTMIILAIYYTLADIVLLFQLFYYRGFTLSDNIPAQKKPSPIDAAARGNGTSERSPLLQVDAAPNHGYTNGLANGGSNGHASPVRISDIGRRQSQSSFTDRILLHLDEHLSPAVPILADHERENPSRPRRDLSAIKSVLFNASAIILVCAAGVLGWWLSNHDKPAVTNPEPDSLQFNVLGQVFGYICAVLYLASRVPQLLLNYRRKSTDGISMLFFLFACIGNLTYVLSIFAYSPICKKPNHCKPGEAAHLYGRYIALNASWLAGSMGTLFLDAAVFVQYFLYKKDEE